MLTINLMNDQPRDDKLDFNRTLEVKQGKRKRQSSNTLLCGELLIPNRHNLND